MRKFGFSNFISIKERVWGKIVRNPLLYISLAAVFIIGIVLGFVLKKTDNVYVYYLEYSQNYYDLILNRSQSVFGLFIKRVINNFCYFILICLACFTIYLSFVHFLIYLYRGFLLGTICGIIISQFGFSGVVCCIFLVIPQHIITTLCLIMASGCGMERALLWHRQKSICDVKHHICCCLLLLLASFIGSLIEQLLLLLLLRPLNFYF